MTAVLVMIVAVFQRIGGTGDVQEYRDPILGVRLRLPAGWEPVVQPAPPGGAPAPDRTILFQDPGSDARFTLAAWDAAGLAPFPLWLGVVAGGWVPVEGEALNASIAGNPASVLWRPPGSDAPAEYGAYLEREGRYYVLAYLAADGGAALGDYRAALESLRVGGSEDANRIPGIPAPGDS